jgi:hypothetical protein
VSWWQRFWVTVSVVLTLALALCVTIYAFIRWNDFFSESPGLTTKYIDFDFAGYCFGIIAVAVSGAGVYISLVVRPLSVEMVERIETHLMPVPFHSVELAEKTCAPQDHLQGFHRGPEVKIIYAAIRLSKWVTLEDDEKLKLMGPEGLDAGKLGFGKGFSKYEALWDRQLVFVIALLICIVYGAVPWIYLFSKQAILAIAVLWTLYVMAIVEAAVCACLYWKRANYLQSFERHLGGWSINIEHHIIALEAMRLKVDKSQRAAGAEPP